MSEFILHRIGIIMEPEPGNDMEIEGVLNPAAVRGPDGALYLFPRLVGKDNYSRIGIARVKFNDVGDPIGVVRLGIALEPEAEYEKRPGNGGGCEDPRISFVDSLARYLMTYTAYSTNGPRIALAQSKDLIHWERLGLAKFLRYKNIEFNGVDNKDACIFSSSVLSKHNHLSMAMLHRPLFPGTRPEDIMKASINRKIEHHHECIWISYCHVKMDPDKPKHLARFESNQPLAIPSAPWETLKIGAGTPPVLTKHGWLILYHGVSDMRISENDAHKLRYSAGVMILDKEHPEKILYRSPNPVLSPDLPKEQIGTIANVVFPTGIDRRDDLGKPNLFDVYYGMADNRIGVARMIVPDILPNV